MKSQIENQDIIEAYLDFQRQGKPVCKKKLAAQFPSREIEILKLLEVVEELDLDGGYDNQIPTFIPDELTHQYSLLNLIGAGGNGSVFEANHKSRGLVALKLISTAKRDFRIERFQREAAIASQLHHSNIVPVYDYGVFEELCFISMQLIRGTDLAKAIQFVREKPTSCENPVTIRLANELFGNWKKIARLGFDVCKALEYSHHKSILHRDIKPGNLLVDENHKVWVTDFGLAKINQPNHTITRTGNTVGTIKYMAPEQLNNQSDERTDVYCLGLTLYELAFPKSKSFSSPVARYPLEQPSNQIQGFPDELEKILFKACDQQPTRRFQNVSEFADVLGAFANQRKIKIRQDNPEDTKYVWNSLLCATVLLLFCLTIFFDRSPPKPVAAGLVEVTKTIPNARGFSVSENLNTGVKRLISKVASSLDDAEEGLYGKVDVADEGIDMVWDGHSKTVGLRFRNIVIPRNARIQSAYIQFTSAQSNFAKTQLTIRGELSGTTGEFLPAAKNISNRSLTNSAVRWQVPHWQSGDGGEKQRTPNLAPVLREIVRDENRQNDQPVAFVISGHGRRCAIAFDKNPDLAPKLILEYTN